MARRGIRLTDAQWAKIEPHLPCSPRRRRGGRPRIDNRSVLEGILLGVENRRALARPTPRVSQRLHLLASVARLGRARRVAEDVARLPRRARRTWPPALGECVPRWLIRPGEKGGSAVGKTKRGKGSKCMAVVGGTGIPLGISITAATPAEVTLVDATLKTVAVPRADRGRPRQKPPRIIADRGYDSDPLRARLARRGIALIVPYRENRVDRPYEDGRRLRRYRHRWIIERIFAWLGAFRRLVVRYERHVHLYAAFVHFACALIALRRF